MAGVRRQREGETLPGPTSTRGGGARWERGHILRKEAETGRRPAPPRPAPPRPAPPRPPGPSRRSWSPWGFLNKCGHVIHHLNTHFSPYAFLLVTYYLLCIFILDHGKDVRPKANLSNFLIQFKMGCRAAERTRNISNALGPGAASAGVCQEVWRRR